MKKKFLSIMFLCFIVLSFLSTSLLAIMKGLTTEELTRSSDIVISGEVEKTEAQWGKDRTTIVTSADIIVNTVIRGTAFQTKISVEYEGGEVGEMGLKVSDQPALIKGEKVILFLKSAKSKRDGDAYNIVGKGQGKYLIGSDGIARKSGFSVADGEENIDNNMPADKLIEKIKRVE